MAFISPVFLFPNDAGGKIRTTNILRGLRHGAFDVTLMSPATASQAGEWATALDDLCVRFESWEPPLTRPRWRRALDLLAPLPVNVSADDVPQARRQIEQRLSKDNFDVVVFDFVHSAVLKPARLDMASICFTHNVEAEIFQRHAKTARNPLMRAVWASQHGKMRRYEQSVLKNFTAVVTVSQRDADMFRRDSGLAHVADIPTGVDLDFFSWVPPPPIDEAHPPTVVFTGSMDWEANIDGVTHFLSDVWPLVLRGMPQARFVVVGRNPPASLLGLAQRSNGVSFTGFVDDVRPYVQGAHVFVIPLRVGGGTRIKAFEAMAMGCPVVSTRVGIEGLSVEPDAHYLMRDDPEAFARGVLALLEDAALRDRLSRQARRCMEEHFGHRVAAEVFERICLQAHARYMAAGERA